MPTVHNCRHMGVQKNWQGRRFEKCLDCGAARFLDPPILTSSVATRYQEHLARKAVPRHKRRYVITPVGER